jgi:hypothetical protein
MNTQPTQTQDEIGLLLATDNHQAQIISQSIELNWEQLESIAGAGGRAQKGLVIAE